MGPVFHRSCKMRKIKWFQDPDQFYAVYNQLMGSRPKLVLSAHLFYSLPLEDTVYKSVYGQVPGLSDIIERGKAEMRTSRHVCGFALSGTVTLTSSLLAFHPHMRKGAAPSATPSVRASSCMSKSIQASRCTSALRPITSGLLEAWPRPSFSGPILAAILFSTASPVLPEVPYRWDSIASG